MKKQLIMANTLMIAMSVVGAAQANTKNWTGFYAGVNAGLVVNDVQLTSQQLGFANPSDTCNRNTDFSMFSPGVQFGYLHQFSNAVVSGIEIGASFKNNQKNIMRFNNEFDPAVYDGFVFKNEMQTAIKGRLGRALAWHRTIFLPYVMAGAGFAKVGLTYENEGGDYYSTTTTHVGWLVGTGVEWAFRQNWSLRAEYYFADYEKAVKLAIPTVYGLDDPNGNGVADLHSNNILVAINYWI